VVVPEHAEYSSELQAGISRLKERAVAEIANPGIRQKVLNSLKQANDAMMKVVEKGLLKKGKKVDKSNVNVRNTMLGKRDRLSKKVKFADTNERRGAKKKSKDAERFKAGDTITAESTLFDGKIAGSYSKANPELQIGVIIKAWKEKGIVQVKWLDGSKSYQKMEDLTIQKRKDVKTI
jgi:hypothetical protein